MKFDELALEQRNDPGIQALHRTDNGKKIQRHYFGGINLFVIKGQGPQSKEWKIAVPATRIQAIMDWYHNSLNHPGST